VGEVGGDSEVPVAIGFEVLAAVLEVAAVVVELDGVYMDACHCLPLPLDRRCRKYIFENI
jgi:hypothetical protein